MHTTDLASSGRSLARIVIVGLVFALTPAAARSERGAEATHSRRDVAATVEWNGPTGQPVSAMKVRLSVPATLELPATAEQVKARISETPANAVVIVDRSGDSLDVVVSRAESLPRGQLFVLDLERVGGSDARPAVACEVLDCASSFGPVSGCACAFRWR